MASLHYLMSMKLGMIESAWFGTKVDPITGVKLAKEIGFDTYDIYHDPRMTPIKERKKLRETLEEVGLKCVAMTTACPSITDINPTIRRFSIGWIKEQLDLGYDLGCDKMVIALGEYIWEKQVIKPEEQWSWAVEAIREIGDYAKDLDMQIAIELEPFKLSLINSIDAMIKFLDDVDHPAVKANADVSHLHLIRAPPEDLKRLGDRIIHVHFSDNNGKVHGDLPPGRGNAPLKEYLKILKEIGYNGAISIELEFCPIPDKVIDWVKEAYTATAKMMDELKIRE